MIKKKILHIQLLPILSGVQNAMLYLIGNLPENEYEISVLSAPGGSLRDVVQKMGMKHIALPGLKRLINFYDLVVLIRFYRVCRKFKFDLVHTHSSKTGFLGRIAAKLAGIPAVVHTVHGFPFHEHQSKFAFYFYKMLEKVASYFCDKIVSVNKHEWKESVQSGLVKKDKMTYVYNGVEDIKVKESKYTKTDFGFSEKSVVFGTVCRFSSQKNIIDTVKSAIQAVQQKDNVKFIFVGNGEFFSVVKNMVEKNGMTDSIIFPGWQQNISDWLAFFDVFILFSNWEGLPLSIIEALSAGLPVIASDIKGNNELVEHGVNGFLIKNHEKYEFIDKISFLAEKNEIRNRMGEQSLRIFEQNFTVENYQKKYNQLYQKLFSEKL